MRRSTPRQPNPAGNGRSHDPMFTPRRRLFIAGTLLAFVVLGAMFHFSRDRVHSAAAEPIHLIIDREKPARTQVKQIAAAGEDGIKQLDASLTSADNYRTAEVLFDTFIEATRPEEEKTHTGRITRFGFGSQFRRIKKLLAMLQNAEGRGAKAFAVSQIMGLGFRDMTKRVASLLADPKLDAMGRIALLEVLACSKKPEAARLVRRQCTEAEVGAVRAAAVRVLSKMEDPKLYKIARGMLDGDPSALARTAAAEAIADCLRFEDKDAKGRVAFLLQQRTSEESSLCRAQLMRAAVHSGWTDPRLLGRVLAAKSVPLNEKRAAARAITEMNSPAAVKTLEKHLKAGLDQPTRRLVFNALRRMTTPTSREALARWTAAPATRPAAN